MREPIDIIGAGLVGSLLATLLGQRGHSIQLYERRPDLRKNAISAGRSINLALSTRGIHALKLADVDQEILSQALPMHGRMMHALDGTLTFQPYGRDESECIYSISRATLNQVLLTRAEQTGRVQIEFEKKITASELIGKNLLIGTDGSGSEVRKKFYQLPQFKESQSLLDYGYKEFHIPPGPGGNHLILKNALHIWPRGHLMLIALPNFDGSFTCTLFLPFAGELSFEALTEKGAVHAFFRRYFADVLPLLHEVEATFIENPTGHMVTVKCSPWFDGERTLLLGDAAHAIVPFFGQGMNCGFEDCTELLAFMDQNPQDWDLRLGELSASRSPDCDAIADMAVENFIEMRDKVAQPQFLLEKSVEKILQRHFEGKYFSRYALVTFSRAPYRVASAAGRVCDEILAELCQGLNSPDQVDLNRAQDLIESKLTPILKGIKNGSTN